MPRAAIIRTAGSGVRVSHPDAAFVGSPPTS